MSVSEAEQLANIAMQVLDQKAVCQQDPDQDETDEAPEDTAEYDSILISSAGDLVASLANALGPDFSQAFPTFFALIAKYYVSIIDTIHFQKHMLTCSAVQKKNRSLSDRSSAIGCLAEIIAGMKSAVTPHTEALLDLFYRALSDPESEVQTNAAFAAGLLVEHSEMDLSPQYLHLLAALRPLFAVTPDSPSGRFNARDNAVGAVARLIARNTAAVPLDQVLPVFFDALPLKHDFLENRPVFKAIFHLFATQPQVLSPYLDKLLQVFAYVLDPSGPDQVGDEVRAELIRLIALINSEQPAKVQAAGLTAFL